VGSTVFVGRIEELHGLTRALRRHREGEPMLVVVERDSGIGAPSLPTPRTSGASRPGSPLRLAGRLPEPFSGVALDTALERGQWPIEVVGAAVYDDGEFSRRSGSGPTVRISFSRAAASPLT